MSGVKRATRVAGRLQEELSAALRGLRDPRLEGVLVSRVELTDDLQLAKVYVRRELGGDDEVAIKAALKGLGAAAGRLRHATAQALGLRYAPTFRFFYDEAPDAMARIEELLREVKRDGSES
ncbi:Ribosome-binding factor A [Minicystis rosea]|nr:Ribosome-binding factor A [Minicystis rosea]